MHTTKATYLMYGNATETIILVQIEGNQSLSVCKSICLSVLLLHNALSFSYIKSDLKRKVVIFTLLHVLSFKLLLPNHPLKVGPHSIFIPWAPSEPQNNKKLPLR